MSDDFLADEYTELGYVVTWHGNKMGQILSELQRVFSPKRVAVYISIILLLPIVFFLVYDVVNVFAVQKPDRTSQSFSVVVLGIHAFAFFLGLLGFTFFNISLPKDRTMVRLSAAVIVFTLWLSIARILLEMLTLGFREEAFSSLTDDLI